MKTFFKAWLFLIALLGTIVLLGTGLGLFLAATPTWVAGPTFFLVFTGLFALIYVGAK